MAFASTAPQHSKAKRVNREAPFSGEVANSTAQASAALWVVTFLRPCLAAETALKRAVACLGAAFVRGLATAPVRALAFFWVGSATKVAERSSSRSSSPRRRPASGARRPSSSILRPARRRSFVVWRGRGWAGRPWCLF